MHKVEGYIFYQRVRREEGPYWYQRQNLPLCCLCPGWHQRECREAVHNRNLPGSEDTCCGQLRYPLNGREQEPSRSYLRKQGRCYLTLLVRGACFHRALKEPNQLVFFV